MGRIRSNLSLMEIVMCATRGMAPRHDMQLTRRPKSYGSTAGGKGFG